MPETIFQELRPYLFSIAYRMLGSVMDAEDIVQEAYLRWLGVDPAAVDSPRRYLAAVVTRLGIDLLRSARSRRETYIGPWLPEPLLTSREPSPADSAALTESVSVAFLLLLDRLRPNERAAFLLREVFDFEYAEIAEILEKTGANCRQIVRRARRKLEEVDPGLPHREPPPPPAEQEALLTRFFQAVTQGDVDGLVSLLTADAEMVTDSNGLVVAARRPVIGADPIARFFVGVMRLAPEDFALRLLPVNGVQGVVYYEAGRPAGAMTFGYAKDGAIRSIYNMRNPEKLAHLPPLS